MNGASDLRKNGGAGSTLFSAKKSVALLLFLYLLFVIIRLPTEYVWPVILNKVGFTEEKLRLSGGEGPWLAGSFKSVQVNGRELGEVSGSAAIEYRDILKSVPQLVGSLIMDYHGEDSKYARAELALDIFNQVERDELVNLFTIARTLGYEAVSDDAMRDRTLIPRGYRLLNSTRLPSQMVGNVVKRFKDLHTLMDASFDDLTEVPGIGKARARVIIGVLERKKKERGGLSA